MILSNTPTPRWLLPLSRPNRARTFFLVVAAILFVSAGVSFLSASTGPSEWSSKINHINPWTKANQSEPVPEPTPEPASGPLLEGHAGHDTDEGLYPEWDGEKLNEHRRIGKVSILYGEENPAYERALRTHEAHDRLYGYPIFVLREPILDGYWTKPAYILSLLLREMAKPRSQRLEWLFWIDADTIILNYKVPIELFLPPIDDPEFRDVHVLYTNDWNGLNNGVFPIRVNQWAVELFSNILSFRHFRPEQRLPFQDQSAMEYMLREPRFARHAVQVPQRWFNAYRGDEKAILHPDQVRRGDFLVHFAGVGDRERAMRFWCDRAEEKDPQWVVDLEHTQYPSEVKEFWAHLKETRAEIRVNYTDTRANLSSEIANAEVLLAEVGSMVAPGARKAVQTAIAESRQFLNQPGREEGKSPLELQRLNRKLSNLLEAVQPLRDVSDQADANIAVVAYDLIQQAENNITQPEASTPAVAPELAQVQASLAALKSALLTPNWQVEPVKNLVLQLERGLDDLAAKIAATSASAGSAGKKDKAQPQQQQPPQQPTQASTSAWSGAAMPTGSAMEEAAEEVGKKDYLVATTGEAKGPLGAPEGTRRTKGPARLR